MKIHKLVYLTWIGKIDDDKQINHRDDNREKTINNPIKKRMVGHSTSAMISSGS